MNEDKARAAVLAFLDRGRDEWDRVVPDRRDIQAVESAASGLAQVAAEISEYLTYRGAAGFGDHGHEAALKAAGKRLRKVRRALGYNIP